MSTRENGRPVLVALTGWGQDEDRRRSDGAGFDAHLVKPVDVAFSANCWPNSAPAPGCGALTEVVCSPRIGVCRMFASPEDRAVRLHLSFRPLQVCDVFKLANGQTGVYGGFASTFGQAAPAFRSLVTEQGQSRVSDRETTRETIAVPGGGGLRRSRS